MAVAIDEQTHDGILVVHVSGKLSKEDYEMFVPELERRINEHDKVRMLVDMEDFHGWDAGALWEDTKFAARHYQDIDRLALVGEKAWQKGMAMFCKPFTGAEIRYFERSQINDARNWIEGQ